MRKEFIFLLFIFFFYSCRIKCIFSETIDLGDYYAVVESDIESIEILFCTEPKCCDIGIPVVPSKVIEYNYNSQWIIAKSLKREDESTSFWIIEKRKDIDDNFNIEGIYSKIKSSIKGPLDSLTFTNEVKKNNINLKFIKYKSQ